MRKQHDSLDADMANGQTVAPAAPGAASAPTALVWFARCAAGLVFAWNVMCAVQFVVWPEAYAPAYGLPSTPESAAMVAGLGVAFLMWNATYPLVIWQPARYRVLFGVVLAQQAIGLVGELLIWSRLVADGLATGAMAGGILRFVAFDAVGLAIMAAAYLVTRPAAPSRPTLSS